MRGVCSRRSYIPQLFIDICAWFQSYHFRAVPDQKFIWRNEWFPSPAEHTPSQLLQLSTQTMRWLQPNRPIEPSVPTLMGCTVNGNNGEMKSFQFNYYYCCELRMIDVNCDSNGNYAGVDVEKHTAGALCFRFSPSTDSTSISISIRFLPQSFVTFSLLRTEDDDVDDHKSVSIYECAAISSYTRPGLGQNERADGTKENTTNSDGIIFITNSCYQVGKGTHSRSLASFEIANGLCGAVRCGAVAVVVVPTFRFYSAFASIIVRNSIYFALTRDGWLTWANTFGFRLFAWSMAKTFVFFFSFLLHKWIVYGASGTFG